MTFKLVPVVNAVDLTAVNSDIPIKTVDLNEKKGWEWRKLTGESVC